MSKFMEIHPMFVDLNQQIIATHRAMVQYKHS